MWSATVSSYTSSRPRMQAATRCFIVACRFLGPLVPRFRRVMPLWGGKGFFPDVALRILPHRLAVDQHRYGFAVADAHRHAFTGAPDSYVPSLHESLKHFRAVRRHEQPAWTGGPDQQLHSAPRNAR